MKFKLFWIIALATANIFLITSCLTFTESNSSDRKSLAWPSQSTWEEYGISGGLRQPSGTTVVFVGYPPMGPVAGKYVVTLYNADMIAFTDIVNQIEAKGGWEVVEYTPDETGAVIGFNFHVSDTVYNQLIIVYGDNELGIILDIITL